MEQPKNTIEAEGAELNGGSRSVERLVGRFSCKEHDALWTALHHCAGCYRDEPKPYPDAEAVYSWLTATTRHGLVCELVDQLHAMGFSIVPNAADERHSPAKENL
jgi:hypothetical protein